MTERPTHELAADVREVLRVLYRDATGFHSEYRTGLEALDALVARITDLEAEVLAKEKARVVTASNAAEFKRLYETAEAQVGEWAERFAALSLEHTQALRDADAAEAQVAALTQAAKALRYPPDPTRAHALVNLEDFYALAAAVRRVDGDA